MAVNLFYIPASLRPSSLPFVEEVRVEKVPSGLWAADLPDHKPPTVEPIGDLELPPPSGLGTIFWAHLTQSSTTCVW